MEEIRKIEKNDPYSFFIEWSSGEKKIYYFSELQNECPCHFCRDPKTGKSLKEKESLTQHVEACRLTSVGNYALKISFKTGCSFGIYSYHLLSQLGKKAEKGGL